MASQTQRVADPAGRWFASRAARMVLVSIILVLLALIILYSAGSSAFWAWRLLRTVADTMLVVSATVFLTELGPFRSYVEERLQALTRLLDRPTFDRLTDPSYLRDNFRPELLLNLRKASTCASLPSNINDYPEFLSVIEKVVIPLAGQSVWRKDFHLNITHTLEELNGQTVLRQESSLSSVYVNTGDDPKDLDIPIEREFTKVPGVSNEQLCCGGWVKTRIEGEHEAQVPLDFKLTDLGKKVRFQSLLRIQVGSRPVTVSTGYEALVGPNETTRVTFTVPTTGLSVTYMHPREIEPELFCFNVGGELTTIADQATLHQWEHNGTFLPHHGIVLTHALKRRKGEGKFPRKMPAVSNKWTDHQQPAAS